jgi:hypothetical protein
MRAALAARLAASKSPAPEVRKAQKEKMEISHTKYSLPGLPPDLLFAQKCTISITPSWPVMCLKACDFAR